QPSSSAAAPHPFPIFLLGLTQRQICRFARRRSTNQPAPFLVRRPRSAAAVVRRKKGPSKPCCPFRAAKTRPGSKLTRP
uniref:Uncharacterized protein n=1 Tax=Cucumis melo TaxID=3656 RepID=A0A9I9E3E8_CUCME